jgi:hypothetical protein
MPARTSRSEEPDTQFDQRRTAANAGLPAESRNVDGTSPASQIPLPLTIIKDLTDDAAGSGAEDFGRG